MTKTKLFIICMGVICMGIFQGGCQIADQDSAEKEIIWKVGKPIFTASDGSDFDNISVKDPSIVYYNKKWHLFYTAFGNDGQMDKQFELHIGYVNAHKLNQLNDAKRTMLKFTNVNNPNDYYAAPQVFYFKPHKKWYLVFQGYWNNVQPLYSTTDNIEDPASWTQPKELMPKFEGNSWVDFYVICDDDYAYLTYSRNYNSVYAVKTRLEDFPAGFDYKNAQMLVQMLVQDTSVEFGEAAHIYRAKGLDEYHMIYEICDVRNNHLRYYMLYRSDAITGPWQLKYPVYATQDSLGFGHTSADWPEEVSHGEMLRTNYDQTPEYNPKNVRFLMQGILSKERGENYDPSKYWSLPWKFGILETKINASLLKKTVEKLYIKPSDFSIIAVTSEAGGIDWKYTTTKPDTGWQNANYDDAAWLVGQGGLGTKMTPGSTVRTEWKTPDIWVRRTFEFNDEKPKELYLKIFHDEDAQVYLNGQLIAEVSGYTTSYTMMPLDKTAMAALKKGENLIAVHCHQTQGGQYIDVGLSGVR